MSVQVARIEGFDVVVPTRSEALFAPGSISNADVRGTTLRALLGHTSGRDDWHHLGGTHGFTSAFDVAATDGTGVVVMSDVHNGFGVVLPQVVETLAERVDVPVGTWRA